MSAPSRFGGTSWRIRHVDSDALRAIRVPDPSSRDRQLGNHSGFLEISEIGQPGLESAEDLMVVVMGEVHLDDEETFDKLSDILFGFERMDQPPPAVYVFMGNFTRKTVNLKLVFVPGPEDPAGVGGLLPIPALGDHLTQGIASRKKYKGVHMCSNPVRIRMDLGGQVVEEEDGSLSNKADFMAFRSPDVCRKLYSNCIVRQLESADVATKEDRQRATNREFFRAISRQGHLCPVSRETQPVVWGLDHLLQLYSPPNAVFICDHSVTPHEELLDDDMIFCSTGEFKRSLTDDEGFPFYVYRPFAPDYRYCVERSNKTVMHPHSALVMYRNRGGHLLQNEDIMSRILVVRTEASSPCCTLCANRIGEGAAGIRPSDTVLEMGPGTGNMTVKLGELANHVVAVEVNEGLAKEVERRAEMKGASNMEVVTGDFKRLALPRFDVVIANLPYHLATGFLLKLMGHPFRTGIIMLQHEFGKKLLADPGEKIYSRLSLNMRMFFKAERICK
ncbi:DNA polymerase epsilon subunit 2, partial [Perkinsus olseni]